MFLNLMTEIEGNEIQKLIENHRFSSAYSKVKKYLERDDPEIRKYGPYGPERLSDAVPDEWFDGCKTIIDLLSTKIKGIIPIDIDEDYC